MSVRLLPRPQRQLPWSPSRRGRRRQVPRCGPGAEELGLGICACDGGGGSLSLRCLGWVGRMCSTLLGRAPLLSLRWRAAAVVCSCATCRASFRRRRLPRDGLFAPAAWGVSRGPALWGCPALGGARLSRPLRRAGMEPRHGEMVGTGSPAQSWVCRERERDVSEDPPFSGHVLCLSRGAQMRPHFGWVPGRMPPGR